MDLPAIAAAFTIIGVIVSTTMIVVGRIAKLEVMIAELRVQVAQFEHRISTLEGREHERQP